MRIGVTSRNPIVWALQAAGWMPEPLFVSFWGMEASRAIITGVELGLFDAVAEQPRSAADLARDLGYDEVGVEALLNALNGFGYLRRRGGVFSLTRRSRRWLASESRHSLAQSFGLMRVLWDELGDMEERVRHGGDRDFHRPDRDADFWRRYEVGLGAAAKLTAGVVVRSVRFDREPQRLLDVGGGHGMFSAAFCKRYPGLQAQVLDLAPAAAVGRELVEEQGLSDRITYQEGDLLTAQWGEGYDVVLVFNVLHVLTPDAAVAVLERARTALRPGGTLVVLDSVHRGATGDIDAVGGGSELLFYAINGTRAYSEEQMLEWVRAAGFDRVRRQRLLALPEALITARTPAR